MILAVEAQARAEGAQDWADGDVGAVEPIGHAPLERHADARRAPLDDQGLVLDPHPVGQPRQEWIGRREDASIRHVRGDVAREQMAVE
jgi:hypothetical protein